MMVDFLFNNFTLLIMVFLDKFEYSTFLTNNDWKGKSFLKSNLIGPGGQKFYQNKSDRARWSKVKRNILKLNLMWRSKVFSIPIWRSKVFSNPIWRSKVFSNPIWRSKVFSNPRWQLKLTWSLIPVQMVSARLNRPYTK